MDRCRLPFASHHLLCLHSNSWGDWICNLRSSCRKATALNDMDPGHEKLVHAVKDQATSAGIGEVFRMLFMPLSLPKAPRRHIEDFFYLRLCMVDKDHAKLSGDECSASVSHDANSQMDQARPTEEFIYRESVNSRYI